MTQRDSTRRERHRAAPSDALRLDIEPIIASAEEIERRVANELPGHSGLAKAARGVAEAAHEADRVSQVLRRPLGLHRLPAAFLLAALLAFALWIYWQFIHTSTLEVAVSVRDAVQLSNNVSRRVRFITVTTVGSRESIGRIQDGEVDLAFVQGGVKIPDEFPRTKLSNRELVLLFLREGIRSPTEIKTILTSSQDQGSHTLAQVFTKIWQPNAQVSYVHQWRAFTDDPAYEIDASVDAVFVVKDPMNDRIVNATTRLERAGFQLASPDIGAWSLRLPYLEETVIRPGYLGPTLHVPQEPIATYAVATYLVSRPDLTSGQLAAAWQLITSQVAPALPHGFEPTLNTANEVAQGLEAMLGIVVYIGVAFFALLGLDIVTYRRRFNELNSLVSLVSMHQSAKDVMFGTPENRMHNVVYLGVCSDLLGLIAVITGYYTQENASLLYNRLLEIIHERCSGLKINIQLKILHALLELPAPSGAHEPLTVESD